MSLPDTIFIFVLALIIFGPKKLPEIGRQIGKLVGEFRRASNEFKFQIEEELRQADLNDTRKERQTISSPTIDIAESKTLPASNPAIAPVNGANVEESLPVGQHPNIDHVELSNLLTAETSPEDKDEQLFAPAPALTAAIGTEPRATVPYAVAEPLPESRMADSPGKSASESAALEREGADFSDRLTMVDINHG